MPASLSLVAPRTKENTSDPRPPRTATAADTWNVPYTAAAPTDAGVGQDVPVAIESLKLNHGQLKQMHKALEREDYRRMAKIVQHHVKDRLLDPPLAGPGRLPRTGQQPMCFPRHVGTVSP